MKVQQKNANKKSQYRCTKGASKQRRDSLNTEIAQIREVLPMLESKRQPMSQIQVMALTTAYMRRIKYLSPLFPKATEENSMLNDFDFTQALPGFLLAISFQDQLLYASENVKNFLGFSSIELLTRAGTVYDIVCEGDRSSLKKLLREGFESISDHFEDTDTCSVPAPSRTHSIACRLKVSRSIRRQSSSDRYKLMHIRGHFVNTQQFSESCEDQQAAGPLFIGLCSSQPCTQPQDSTIFTTKHSTDMKFMDTDENGEYHLGYSKSEVNTRSWYACLHPDDSSRAQQAHAQVMKGGVTGSLYVRMQTAYGHFISVCVNLQLCKTRQGRYVLCSNRVMSDKETNLQWPNVREISPNDTEHTMEAQFSFTSLLQSPGLPDLGQNSIKDRCGELDFDIEQELILDGQLDISESHADSFQNVPLTPIPTTQVDDNIGKYPLLTQLITEDEQLQYGSTILSPCSILSPQSQATVEDSCLESSCHFDFIGQTSVFDDMINAPLSPISLQSTGSPSPFSPCPTLSPFSPAPITSLFDDDIHCAIIPELELSYCSGFDLPELDCGTVESCLLECYNNDSNDYPMEGIAESYMDSSVDLCNLQVQNNLVESNGFFESNSIQSNGLQVDCSMKSSGQCETVFRETRLKPVNEAIECKTMEDCTIPEWFNSKSTQSSSFDLDEVFDPVESFESEILMIEAALKQRCTSKRRLESMMKLLRAGVVSGLISRDTIENACSDICGLGRKLLELKRFNERPMGKVA